MTDHRPEHVKSGLRLAWSFSSPRRADETGRRTGEFATRVALVRDRQGVSLRDRRRPSFTRPALQRTLTAAHLSLHVRARLQGGLSILFGDCGRLQWIVAHLVNHDVAFCAVSQAPLGKLQAYKRRMGWSFPWASSFDSDFNYDFRVTHTDEEWSQEPSSTTFRVMDFRQAEGDEVDPSISRVHVERRNGLADV